MKAFILAMDYEIGNIFDLSKFKLLQKKPFLIYKNTNNLIIRSGVGKVNAAAATQYLIDNFKFEKLINLGLAGAISKEIKLSEVNKISTVRFFDVDVTAFDKNLGQIYDCDITNYKLSKLGKKIITGDIFVTDIKNLDKILKVYKADLIDMEIAAIAHTLYINDKSNMLESYKAASDYADGSASKQFFKNQKKSFLNLSKLVMQL